MADYFGKCVKVLLGNYGRQLTYKVGTLFVQLFEATECYIMNGIILKQSGIGLTRSSLLSVQPTVLGKTPVVLHILGC